MNRNEFVNMIEDTIPVNRQMIGEVYELIDIFPYFQSAHMLLLKGLQNNADVKFENQLRNSAIHIADREVLYYLLKTKPSDKIEAAGEKVGSVSSVANPYENQQTVIESAKNSEQLINEIEKNSGEIIQEPQEPQESENVAGSHSVLISSESDNEEHPGVMFLVDEDPAPEEESVFYMDPGFSIPDNSDLLELDLDLSTTNVVDDFVISDEKSDINEKNSQLLSQSELIDKFIISNPRIEPVKEKPILPVEDKSKPFVEEEGGFITETLARIYFNQSYYSKAIDIYEKLSLKFPEKSSYFASQIEKVKEYIKN